MNPLEAENANYLWAQMLMGEFVRQGVGHVIVCPGSRSSPLAIAAVRTTALRTTVVIDERCAGFIALGIAKASSDGAPAVVVTTSGTAVANLLPAVVEASSSGTPMIVVTADRPPELRECGANQSIAQQGIFASYPRWSFELPAPGPEIDPSFVVSVAAELVARSRLWPPGPVHLNASFREPLAPTPGPLPSLGPRLVEWAGHDRCWRREAPRRPAAPDVVITLGGRRTLVVAGAGAAAAVGLARVRGMPCIADVTAREAGTGAIDGADVILAALGDDRLASLRERLRPDSVIRTGGPISSRRVAEFVATAPELVVDRAVARQDDRHAATHVGDFDAVQTRTDPAYESLWRAVAAAAGAAVDQHLASTGDAGPDQPLTEPWIAREVPRRMRPGTLVAGSSMPIRDLDMFWPPDTSRARRVVANRGASGIDGTISTAIGVALGSGGAVTVLLGDLAALHDLGGLANVGRAEAPVHVVVVNNDGGGIFAFLPIAGSQRASEHFERLFGTPHGHEFRGAAAMFGLSYHRVSSRGEAAAALARLDAAGPTLIECVTDRRTNVEAHRSLQRAVADALAKEFL